SAGGTTVIAALPLWPSAAAVILAVPGPWAFTRAESVPVCVATTVATALLLVVHVTVCPATTFPAASLTVARRENDPPTSLCTVAGLTVTDMRVGPVDSPPQAASAKTPNHHGPANIRFICDPPLADAMSAPHRLAARSITAGLGKSGPNRCSRTDGSRSGTLVSRRATRAVAPGSTVPVTWIGVRAQGTARPEEEQGCDRAA